MCGPAGEEAPLPAAGGAQAAQETAGILIGAPEADGDAAAELTITATLPSEAAINAMRVKCLKAGLRAHGLKASGRKAELVSRLLAHVRAHAPAPAAAAAAAGDLVAPPLGGEVPEGVPPPPATGGVQAAQVTAGVPIGAPQTGGDAAGVQPIADVAPIMPSEVIG